MRLDQPVWYVAYGSNLSEERFLRYLQGGPIPNSTTGQRQDAARDQSLPTGDQPFALNRQVFFAGSSARWGDGGVAFLDADIEPDEPSCGRAWQITLGQFEDLFRQENGMETITPIDLDDLSERGRLEVVPKWYGRLEHVGDIEGVPVITLASPKPLRPVRAAHVSYLSVIAEGLASSWGMATHEAARYLSSLQGNNQEWTTKSLTAALEAGREL